MLSNLWYYIQVFFSGDLHFCDKCGDLAKCYPFGKELDNHYKLIESVDKDFRIPKLSIEVFKWGDACLCISCDIEIGEKLRIHQNCCDKKGIQWKEGDDGRKHAWKREEKDQEEAALESGAQTHDS